METSAWPKEPRKPGSFQRAMAAILVAGGPSYPEVEQSQDIRDRNKGANGWKVDPRHQAVPDREEEPVGSEFDRLPRGTRRITTHTLLRRAIKHYLGAK